MLDNFIRPIKETLLMPAARLIGRILSPNWISFIGFVSGLVSVFLVTRNLLAAGLVLWALNRILDGLDGVVARATGRQSDLGGYLDLMYDLFLYIAVPLSFIYRDQQYSSGSTGLYWAGLAMFGAFYINLGSWTLLSALLEKRKQGAGEGMKLTSLEMPWGIIEGTETVIVYSLFYLLPRYTAVLFALFAALTLLSALVRVRWGFWHLMD